MSANVLTLDSAKEANLGVLDDLEKGGQAVHDVVVAYHANRRSGTANTKTRSEVSGSGKKLWRQKGTGRARMGDRRSPIWTGGGVVFGPRPRSYAKAVNKATRRLAFRKALSERIASGDVVLVDSFDVADGKTKSFVGLVGASVETGNALVVGGAFSDSTLRAGRNVKSVQLVSAEEVNTEHLLRYDKVVLVADALETLAKRTNN